MQELKQQYQQKIDKLEERLLRLEAPGTNAPAPPATSAVKPAAPPVEAVGTNNAAAAREFANKQFQRDTESREHAVLAESSPVRERMERVLRDFVDFSGYLRAGYGRDNQGGPQVAFKAPGALSKYRLGNEAEI